MNFFSFLFKLQKKLLLVNSGDPDQTRHIVASDLVMHCLPMFHKKNDRLIWVKLFVASWHYFKDLCTATENAYQGLASTHFCGSQVAVLMSISVALILTADKWLPC